MDHSMNAASVCVTQSVRLELIDPNGAATPIEAQLSYDPQDPYAVTAIFQTGRAEVAWTFGRELLCQGIYEPSGDGDVHVWPCLDADGHAVVIIELSSPDGEALVQTRTGDVRAFVDRMCRAVEPGTESAHLDVDATIAAILEADAA